MQNVANLARQYGVRVISDEIHSPLVMPPSTMVPYLSVAKRIGGVDALRQPYLYQNHPVGPRREWLPHIGQCLCQKGQALTRDQFKCSDATGQP